ncbi:ribosome-binding factor A [Candidatus Babeliales bacterium]|nr:ribosome-binding factor A [Candidatus Babeliales bacterium]
MSSVRTPSSIKRAQRQSYILRELTPILQELFANDQALSKLFVTRLELSPDGSLCHIFFSTFSGVNPKEEYTKASSTLILYKPSVRKALSNILPSRYTPDIRFHYDAGKEKERYLNTLFEKIQEDVS